MQSSKKTAYILAHWGFPYHPSTISPFIYSFIKTTNPFFHFVKGPLIKPKSYLFSQKLYFAHKKDFFNTSICIEDIEELAETLSTLLHAEVIPFYHFLQTTHTSFFEKIENLQAKVIKVLPLFPQYSFSTTGNIAHFFNSHLSSTTKKKLRWIKSYFSHPAFIETMHELICKEFEKMEVEEENSTILFISPSISIQDDENADLYKEECETSFSLLEKKLPFAHKFFCFIPLAKNSEWIEPSFESIEKELHITAKKRRSLLLFPLCFLHPLQKILLLQHPFVSELERMGFHIHFFSSHSFFPKWVKPFTMFFDTPNLCANYMLQPNK